MFESVRTNTTTSTDAHTLSSGEGNDASIFDRLVHKLNVNPTGMRDYLTSQGYSAEEANEATNAISRWADGIDNRRVV